jgi:hypothetical protein
MRLITLEGAALHGKQPSADGLVALKMESGTANGGTDPLTGRARRNASTDPRPATNPASPGFRSA